MAYKVIIDDKAGQWSLANSDTANIEVSSDITFGEQGENENSEEELLKLTVPLLKEKLRAIGLPVSGKKAVLVERLVEAGVKNIDE